MALSHFHSLLIFAFQLSSSFIGGEPIQLPSLANASDEVKERTFVFRNIADYKRLDELTRDGKTIAIIGGGFLGSELACALGQRGEKLC